VIYITCFRHANRKSTTYRGRAAVKQALYLRQPFNYTSALLFCSRNHPQDDVSSHIPEHQHLVRLQHDKFASTTGDRGTVRAVSSMRIVVASDCGGRRAQ
jgi:hypothetical protein